MDKNTNASYINAEAVSSHNIVRYGLGCCNKSSVAGGSLYSGYLIEEYTSTQGRVENPYKYLEDPTFCWVVFQDRQAKYKIFKKI